MHILCLSDLHLRSEAVVDAIDRKKLSPFLSGIAARVAEVSSGAVVVTGDTVCPAQVRLLSALLRSVIPGDLPIVVTLGNHEFWGRTFEDTLEKLKAQTIADMALRYVVITSVDRDDLRDGGAQHFADCITAIREKSPQIKIETLVPDFRGRKDRALDILTATPPDVFNHNLENVPRIYRQVRPGADYNWSLKLLERFKEAHPEIPTKSGLMVGLGETNEEIIEVMRDLRRHGVTMLTLGQYLQPSRHHLPVQRYVSPDEFDEMKAEALAMGFTHAACGPFVRSSYHADLQAKGMEVK